MFYRPLELHRLNFIMETFHDTLMNPTRTRARSVFRTSTYLTIMLPKPAVGCGRDSCVCPPTIFDNVKYPVGHLHNRIDSIWWCYAQNMTKFLLKQSPLQCVDERPPSAGLHEALRLSALRAAMDVAPTPEPSV